MIDWDTDIRIYLHRDPIDFRKAINGLSLIVTEAMQRSLFERAVFVFCNKRHTQLKVLYWDSSGFALWQKRLEKDRFKWPKGHPADTMVLSHEQWQWLLRGFDIQTMKAHQRLDYRSIS